MHVQLLAFATDELSLRVGQTLAGFLNAILVSGLYYLAQLEDRLFAGKCVSKIPVKSIILLHCFLAVQNLLLQCVVLAPIA